MTKPRYAGLFALAIAAFLTFWIWIVPANKYAFDGPTSVPPDPDTVLVVMVMSSAGAVAAATAVWRSRLASPSSTRWLSATSGVLLGCYDLFRFAQAFPYYQG